MSLTSGIDYFAAAPGEVESMNCGACGEKMDVHRDCTGPTGWAEAMTGRGHPHDTFTCPNSAQEWHLQLVKLHVYKSGIPSAALCALVEAEMKQIKESRQTTMV